MEQPNAQRPSALLMADRVGNKDKGKCDGRFWIFIGGGVSWSFITILTVIGLIWKIQSCTAQASKAALQLVPLIVSASTSESMLVKCSASKSIW